MTQKVILAILISFFITSIIGPRLLPLLMRLKFGQFVREDGPQSHLKKQGTPTMGGIIFLLGIVLASTIFYKSDPLILPMLCVVMGFSIIGFIDDYLKVVKKQSEGLKSGQKLLLQCIIAVLFLLYLVVIREQSTKIIIPFTYGFEINLGVFYIPSMLLVILGTVNGVNLTDGVDALATTVTSIVATFFIFISATSLGNNELFSSIVLGSLLGFLLLNAHPAKVFMGDTGSLGLGGFVAAMAIIQKLPLFIVLFGFIYLLETVSVILQVGYFKKTKKRLFKMAPIHHHFELSGMSETLVVTFFSIITIVMSLIAVLAL
jgi:phospho-N-acetylmuramoyl-pentapeptide-transferase